MQPMSAETESIYHVSRIASSDDEEEDDLISGAANKYGSDGEEDDGEEDEPMVPEQALELLKMEQVIRSGYVLKKGEKRRTWKKRWLVLRTTKLAFYKDDKEYKLLRIVDLDQVRSVVHVTSKAKYKYMFAISTPKRTYYLQAPNDEIMESWMASIERSKAAAAQHERPGGDYSDTGHLTSANVPTTAISIPSSQHQPDYSLAGYSTSQSYPLSPNSDTHMIDGVGSSDEEDDDDDEYSLTEDMAHALQEESRNRVLFSGYLLKLGRNKGWRKRWFVLRPDTLAYYKDEKEYVPHRLIPLKHIIDALEIDPISKGKQHCFKIVILKRSYVLCASSAMELASWLEAVSSCVFGSKTGATHEDIQQQHPAPSTAGTASGDMRRFDSHGLFDTASHISGVSSAGAIGGAGGALPGRAARQDAL